MSSQNEIIEQKKKSRIAVVVQRYGKDVNGGAEVHAKMVVSRLSRYYDVEVLTTWAKDYRAWSSYYKVGITEEDAIKIRRFSCEERDELKSQAAMRNIKYSWPVLWRRKLFRIADIWIPYRPQQKEDKKGKVWLESQGPHSKNLLDYISKNEAQYDAFIFCTSLYFTSAVCLHAVASKSILVPHLHNETPTFFPVYQSLFNAAKKIICNTRSELKLMHTIFPTTQSKSVIAGVGVNLKIGNEAEKSCQNNKFNFIDTDYILYLGRVSLGKGCSDLFNYFKRYLLDNTSKVRLIVAGGTDMLTPLHPQIDFLGYVSEEIKNSLLKNAKLLVIPSKYESLSLVLLESFACKIPVLVNKKCEVLKDHILQSSGGSMFENYSTFQQALQYMLNNDALRARQGLAGYEYVKKYYSWSEFDRQYLAAIKCILSKQ